MFHRDFVMRRCRDTELETARLPGGIVDRSMPAGLGVRNDQRN
jgi:hypothetical protein